MPQIHRIMRRSLQGVRNGFCDVNDFLEGIISPRRGNNQGRDRLIDKNAVGFVDDGRVQSPHYEAIL